MITYHNVFNSPFYIMLFVTADAEVPGVFETLCSLDPSSSVGKIGLGWSSLVKKNYEDSMLQLQQGAVISYNHVIFSCFCL